MINNENQSLCSACISRCCSSLPGAVFPNQFKEITVEVILANLKSGYCLDWWEGDPREEMIGEYDHEDYLNQVYYLRPSIKGHENKIRHGSWGKEGDCVFLTSTGCVHIFKDRPRECQGLVPGMKDNHRHCINDPSNNKKAAAIAWIPYQDILIKAADLC